MQNYPQNKLIPSITSDATADLLVQAADVGLDAALESGILSGIPVVGLISSTFKAGREIRDNYLIRKLAKFLESTRELDAEERSQLHTKFHSEAESENFGGMLLLLLERADDLVKPKIIGRLLVSYARGNFTQDDFFRLSKMVDRSFTEDFRILVGFKTGFLPNDEIEAQNLVGLGFLRVAGLDQGDMDNPGFGGTIYELTRYGTWLVEHAL